MSKIKKQYDNFIGMKKFILGERAHTRIVHYNNDVWIMPKFHLNWNERHAYRIPINRQNCIRNNLVLKVLKDNLSENIVKVIDYDNKWVVFKKINGRVLDKSYKGQPKHMIDENDNYLQGLSFQLLYHIMAQITKAVNRLHKLGIAHTDLTLFNIMYNEKNNRIYLVDILGCMPATSQLKELDKKCLFNILKQLSDLALRKVRM